MHQHHSGPPTRVEYVLFDMDGLIIDSERVYTDVTNQILEPYGKKMTWDIKAGCMGKPEMDAARYLYSFFSDIPLPIETYLAEKNRILDEIWPTVTLLPGARKLIQHLKAHNIPIAVATSSRRKKFILKTGHLGDVFDCFEGKVICGDDTEYSMRGKPDPDIFLTAARELLGRNVGHPLEGCTYVQRRERSKGLVFEDSLPGVQSGKRAGMSVVWVPDPRLLDVGYSGKERADRVLGSLEEFNPEEWGLPAYDT
ncbi:hypothetical protein AMATHDRAFT_74609 [Amanita thiersii Skay4041]|uniref:HAD-like protein n=1 Tax=Amanita thiersii Skay4041 TaxID=703135 RepID=A0A2A9NVU7_9AGAR|nr:hypothetical protein AMATHDRAFT_74609 [Amanita thiersii Skay4041]